MSHEYYQPRIKKFTFSELGRIAKSFSQIVLLWSYKILGIDVTFNFALAKPREIVPVVAEVLPAAVRESLDPICDQIRLMGVQTEILHRATTLGAIESYGWSAIMADNSAVLFSIGITLNEAAGGYHRVVQRSFVSETDGRWVSTMGDRMVSLNSSKSLVEVYENKTLDELYLIHLNRLESFRAALDFHPSNFESKLFQIEIEHFNELIDRGAFRPVSSAQTQVLRRGTQGVKSVSEAAKTSASISVFELGCWVAVCLSALLFQSPAANLTQFYFRIGILAIALIGALSSMISRLMRS